MINNLNDLDEREQGEGAEQILDRRKEILNIIDNMENELALMPEILAGKDVWQNKFHEFDVYNHTIDYVRHLKKMTNDMHMIAAGYLHDIGKPVTATPKYKDGKLMTHENGKPYHEFEDHEDIGADMVRNMSKTFFDKYGIDQERVAKFVGAHYLPMDGIKKMRKATDFDSFKQAYNELLVVLDNSGVTREEVMTLFLADCLSKGSGCTDIDELKLVREIILEDGNDRIREIYDLQKTMYGNKE